MLFSLIYSFHNVYMHKKLYMLCITNTFFKILQITKSDTVFTSLGLSLVPRVCVLGQTSYASLSVSSPPDIDFNGRFC